MSRSACLHLAKDILERTQYNHPNKIGYDELMAKLIELMEFGTYNGKQHGPKLCNRCLNETE